MKNFIIYNGNNGKIIRICTCPEQDFGKQVLGINEQMIEGTANDIMQKIIDGKIVDKTSEEIAIDNPPIPEIPYKQQRAIITNEQLQEILNRLKQLENKI